MYMKGMYWKFLKIARQKPQCGDFSEENIRRIMKENGQETEEVLNRIKQIMSKPMIYYGIIARYNDGSHEILQQDLVDYYRGKEEEEEEGEDE